MSFEMRVTVIVLGIPIEVLKDFVCSKIDAQRVIRAVHVGSLVAGCAQFNSTE